MEYLISFPLLESLDFFSLFFSFNITFNLKPSYVELLLEILCSIF